jgi:hypothetical protein
MTEEVENKLLRSVSQLQAKVTALTEARKVHVAAIKKLSAFVKSEAGTRTRLSMQMDALLLFIEEDVESAKAYKCHLRKIGSEGRIRSMQEALSSLPR